PYLAASRDIDPRAAYHELNLSGRIISATFAVPYNTAYAPGEHFDLLPRRGTSALYDSFPYLPSSSCPWNHTLVGWTGEIRKKPTEKVDAALQPSGNKATTPVQVDGVPPTALSQEHGLEIGREDRGRLEEQLERDHGDKVVPVWLPDEWDEKSDEAEHELYTLCHYKLNEPADGRAARKSWADYYCMNKLYVNRILELYKPGDIIIVHEFYLFLLPSLLRQRLRKIYVGFPPRVDAYGVHVAVDVCTTGINVASKQKQAILDPVIEEKIKTINDMYRDKKIIVGRDRLDAARGVLQKLQAFELFLERYPKWREKVVLVQITSPSNISADKKANHDEKMMEKLSDLVARINGTYGSLSFTPNCGSLSGAIDINPWDFNGVAEAINNALTMSEEQRKEDFQPLYEHVVSNTIQAWYNNFLKRLVTNLSSSDQSSAMPALDRAKLLQ
ncbi:glycosyltransferase family 20, partial [Paraphaeosphaeria sporulosa]